MVWVVIGFLAVLAGLTLFFIFRFFFPKKEKVSLPPLSAKLKNLFIELHNYKFFHSPEGVKKVYNRYVGRVRLRQKLKTILTNSETRSGAYLVTGFRGMGKTSLVRKAISEIKGNHYYALSRHFRVFVFTIVIYLLDRSLKLEPETIFLTLFVLNIGGVWYLVWHDQNRPNLWKYYQTRFLFPRLAWLKDAFVSILRIVDLEADYFKRSKFKTLLQDIFIVSLINSLFYLFDKKSDVILESIGWLFIFSFSHFLLIYTLNNIQIELANDPQKRRVRSFFRALKRIFVNAVLRLDYGNKIAIEISLSQDELKEIDILKLLAKNIYAQYRNNRNRLFAPNRIILPLIKIIAVYFAVGVLYYNNWTYSKINEFRQNSSIIHYLPSQALFPDSKNISIKDEEIASFSHKNLTKAIKNHFADSTQAPKIKEYSKGDLQHFTITLDLVFQYYYQKLFHPLKLPPIGKERMSSDFQFFPNLIDYLFVVCLVIVFILIALVEKAAWRFGFINHNYVLGRLKNLNDNIAAQIVMDQGRSVSNPGGAAFRQIFNFFSRKTKTYPVAGVREIENELIEILNEIDRIPSISGRPEFIFIFDELDKIEAQYNANIQDKEREELSSFGKEDEGYFSTESIRRRQETIARILGNLKLFFNTARAKFIFIAGREMYDASLADISDRESFISSIFHEIIYVESFFKDQGTEDGGSITSTTEEFVCQLLMPRYCKYPKTLKGYNLYLKDNFSINNDPLRSLKKWINKKSSINVFKITYSESTHQIENRRKIIYTLEQFITFLTYRGNGAPKKITKLLEEFVVSPDENQLINSNHISAARNSNNLYLYFDYTSQYRLGLTNHLFKPYLISNTGHMRDFGDKMLIATSFLMDHLYKYHKVGFSWENLELTPEIIAINKSPELRRYISRLIDFMANSHIEEIINGLYQFKFTIRIAAEIMYVSTISEVEAAAFNFTLDESLLLKRHYRKKLRSMSSMFNSGVHVSSVAYINTILGDLHFYDREYDEALIHYENAGQFVSNKSFDELNINIQEFIFLIRHLLKMGLTYEKTKDYDSAFISYGMLTKHIRSFANRYKSDWDHEKIRIKRKLSENIRLIFQPLLAQFQVIEKGGPNGVTMEDVARVIDEFYLFIHDLEDKEKFIIEVEFYNKVSDLIYYKNGALISKQKMNYQLGGYETGNLKNIIDFVIKENIGNVSQRKPTTDFRAPLTAYKLYEISLLLFSAKIEGLRNASKDSDIDKALVFNINDGFKEVIEFVKKGNGLGNNKVYKTNKPKDLLKALGGNLSDLADTLICFFDDSEQIDWMFLSGLMDSTSTSPFGDDVILERLDAVGNFDVLSKLNRVFYILFLASQVFLKAGDYYRCLFQLKKILIVIKRVLNYNGSVHFKTLDPSEFNLIKIIGVEAIKILDRSTTHTRGQQVYEWKNYFDISEPKEIDDLFAESIVNQPEAREILIIIKEIELYVKNISPVDILINTRLGLSYSIMNNKYNRVFELYYKCTLNFECFKLIRKQIGLRGDSDFVTLSDPLNQLINGVDNSPLVAKLNLNSAEDVLIYLITDSIYCLVEVLRSFNVFGITYICNHSLNAIVHDHLASWCIYYQRFKELSNKDEQIERFLRRLDDSLDQLLGKIDIQYLDMGYHLKMALQHCYSCLEMHQGGTAYKRAIEEMHYLDDDFDDNLSHFCAAIERYRINSGFIRLRINKIKEKLQSMDERIEDHL